MTMPASQSVAPADNETERLSSSLIGIVSTNAAAIAAIGTAKSAKNVGTAGGRHHIASAVPAAVAAKTNAAVPATVLSVFHGKRAPTTAPSGNVSWWSQTARYNHHNNTD